MYQDTQAQAADISYVYDELGRLRAVIDPANDTAIYSYDAVGNLLSITRQSSAQVSIIEFTPDSGPVGTVVTIFGTGFSTTPSQNTVTFNGTTATVTSATATQIGTTVPAGATTGTIVVTTPTGSATSSTSFTVTTATGAPTITGFSPTIGAPGTAVTINGTNFNSTVASNKARFNIAYATVSSATATSLSTSVPPVATSGRITVSTPYGTTTSAGDFFVPPPPYAPPDVAVTGRLSFGQSTTVTIATANKIGLIVFDGTIGQRVSLKLSSVTMSSVSVSIKNPDGTVLVSGTNSGTGGFLDTTVLPITGTYTIVIDPTGTITGNLTLTLYQVPADVTGTITPGGPSVSVTLSTPGQNALLTFNGTAGQRVSLKLSSSTIGIVYVYLKNPDGSTLASTSTATATGFLDVQTLPATGIYSILVDPFSSNTGSGTLTLYDVPPDVTGTVTIGGGAVPVTITTPGQNASLTFNGTAGQQVTVRITGNTMGSVTVKLLKPDNSVLTSTTSALSNFNLATQTLPTTGTYTITIDPLGANVGSMNVTVTSP